MAEETDLEIEESGGGKKKLIIICLLYTSDAADE